MAGPIVDNIKNSPALICYDMGDERKTFELWGTVAGMAALHQLDPTHSSAQTFFNPETIRAFDPYVSLNVSDIYPVASNRTAAYLYDWFRRMARETDNKRHWMILQSYGAAPWPYLSSDASGASGSRFPRPPADPAWLSESAG